MNTKSQKPIGDYLREYSGLLETWWPSAGDTHELLGAREILHSRLGELGTAELKELHKADARAIELARRHVSDRGWDARMLQSVARVIEAERTTA